MPKPFYKWDENVVLAPCPDCGGATTSFDDKGYSSTRLGTVIINGHHQYAGAGYSRILWQFFRCNVCSRGGVAKIHDNGNSQTAVLESFLPTAIEKAPLPAGLPDDIVKEFREPELEASNGTYQTGSAIQRTALKKTL